jgi:hypothetical protein
MAPLKTEVFYCADWVTKQRVISRSAVTTSGFLSYRSKNHKALSGSLLKKHKPTWTQPTPSNVKRVWLTPNCWWLWWAAESSCDMVTLEAIRTCHHSLDAVLRGTLWVLEFLLHVITNTSIFAFKFINLTALWRWTHKLLEWKELNTHSMERPKCSCKITSS